MVCVATLPARAKVGKGGIVTVIEWNTEKWSGAPKRSNNVWKQMI
jgi:hypothetical protein